MSTAAQGEGADSARAKAEAESVTEPVGLEPRAETERQGCGSLQRMVRRCGHLEPASAGRTKLRMLTTSSSFCTRSC